MGKYRIYPNKSNTLLEDKPTVNTGENEVTELWYGVSGMSRHILRFDFDDYNAQYALGLVPHITASTTTSTFNMSDVYPVLEKNPYANAESPTLANLDVKVVQQAWDAGRGYDFFGNKTVNDESNWYSATSVAAWSSHGGDYLYTVFTGSVSTGGLNFSGDVTDETQLWDVFTGSNHGLSVQYSSAYEALSANTATVLKYFTENAKTKYKMPYIEVSWDNQVTDQRDEVSSGTTKKLYLYLTQDGNLTNAADVSGATVSFSDGDITGITATTINNPMVGVYYIDMTYPTTGGTGVTFTDSWDVKYETGQLYTTVNQTGLTVDPDTGWATTIAATNNDYKINIPKIATEYTLGARVYLEIQALTKYTSTVNILKNMSYKIELIDGNNRIPFVDWDGVSYTQSENFIVMDTSWLHTGYDYALSFKYTLDGITVFDNNERKFRIK